MSFCLDEYDYEMNRIKRKYMQDILRYNQQALLRKQESRKYQLRVMEEINQRQTQDALQSLLQDARKKEQTRVKEKNELKEYYERQIQEKLDRASMEKEKEKVYAISIQNQKDYQEIRRIRDLERIYNRREYIGVRTDQRRRMKTEGSERQKSPRQFKEPFTPVKPRLRIDSLQNHHIKIDPYSVKQKKDNENLQTPAQNPEHYFRSGK